MCTEYQVGDRLLLTNFPGAYGEVEATIYHSEPDSYIIYSEDAARDGHGHGSAYRYSNWKDNDLPAPFMYRGSWWLSSSDLKKLVKEHFAKAPTQRHPNWKVIRKIKEMQDRRRRLGYKYV